MKPNDPRNLPWEKMDLDLEEKKLRKMARSKEPHWDFGYLFLLERQKLICMRLQFSERYCSPRSEEQHAIQHQWIDLCVYLLPFLARDGHHFVSEEQIKKMNCRNLKGLNYKCSIDKFLKEEDENSKYLDGAFLYRKKMERLYYHIRLNHIHEWLY